MGWGLCNNVLMDDDTLLIARNGIQWFIRLLDHNLKLDDDAFEFCLNVLGQENKQFMDKTIELISNSLKKTDPEETEHICRSLENCRSYRQISNHLDTFFDDYPEALTDAKTIVLSALKKRLKTIRPENEAPIETGLNTLSNFFKLNELEKEILFSVYALENYNILNFFDNTVNLRDRDGKKALSIALETSSAAIHKSVHGKLSSLELIDTRCTSMTVHSLAESIFQDPDPVKAADKFFRKNEKPVLPLDFYQIEYDDIRHMVKILRSENADPRHLLLYGEPGGGKTSFAVSLAQELNLTPYFVSIPDKEDSSPFKSDTSRRLCIEVTLNMTDKDALIIVDEADDMLNTESFFGFFSGRSQGKGWINELLERKNVRIVWITNDVSCVPDSTLRRFTHSLPFSKLNRKQRIKSWNTVIAGNEAQSFFNKKQVATYASKYQSSPGIIDIAVKTALAVAGFKRKDFHKALERSLEASRTLHNGGKKKVTPQLESSYSVEGLNIDMHLPELFTQLKMYSNYLDRGDSSIRANMNLLFYGPPGTGKTELSRYIAHNLSKEIIVLRGSDLLDKYVGETEKRIAGAFSTAEEQQSVLLFDEVDSLIFSRENATRSWEVGQVNEFLSNLECFRGIFIGTTNRLNGLDPAAMRRFNHKIKIDYLTPEGVQIMFEKMLAPLLAEPLSSTNWKVLSRQHTLTPGDFKVVRDRFAFYPPGKIHSVDLISALVGEAEIKQANASSRKMGFEQ